MRIVLSAVFLLMLSTLQGQTYEVGVFGGGANNIGDIGRMNYVLPSGTAFGAVVKWNRSKRYAWRAHMMYGSFKADDLKSDIPARQPSDGK